MTQSLPLTVWQKKRCSIKLFTSISTPHTMPNMYWQWKLYNNKIWKNYQLSLEKAINKTRLRVIGNIRDCNTIMINILWVNGKERFYFKWLQNNCKLCSMLWTSLEGRGVWGRINTCICMADSLHCSPETITAMLISYISIQNKKVLKIVFNIHSRIYLNVKYTLSCFP